MRTNMFHPIRRRRCIETCLQIASKRDKYFWNECSCLWSCKKLMFLVIFVCHSVHGGEVWGPMWPLPMMLWPYYTGILLYRAHPMYKTSFLCTGPTPCIPWTCSNLFIMKHVRSASGRLTSCWNAFFLFNVCTTILVWRKNYFYRLQRSWAKVIFSQACVKNSVHRGGGEGVCLSACWDTLPPEQTPPPKTRPPWSRHPPEQTPPEQTPPPPPGEDNPTGSRLQHTVNERPVRILLECILVYSIVEQRWINGAVGVLDIVYQDFF